MVSSLEEPEDKNYVRTHSLAAERALEPALGDAAREVSRGRIFGPREGEYGTGITRMIEGGAWKDEREIVDAYLGAQRHLYTRTRRGEEQREMFSHALGTVEMVSQVRSSVEYTIGDLDHYYEYFGGLSRTVEEVRGRAPVMVFTDSSSSTIYSDDAARAVEIGARTRLLNPRYIEEMLKTRVHGAQQIVKRVENLVGLAATTHAVRGDTFRAVKETFLDDPAMREKLKENNPYALAEIVERLLEAHERGYWEASEAEVEALKRAYLDVESVLEDAGDAR